MIGPLSPQISSRQVRGNKNNVKVKESRRKGVLQYGRDEVGNC